MDTNRCHRASRCALEARRMAIAVPDELQESGRLGTNRALTAVRGSSVAGRGSSCNSLRERICPGVLVTRINKYSEIGNVSAVKMESVIQ